MKVFKWMLPPLLVLVQGVLASSSATSYGKYINTPCTANSDCGLDNHLQCINDYCQCDSLTQIYDQSTHKCLLLLRQQCEVVSGTTSEKHHHNYQQTPPIQCVPFAECTNAVCKCRVGYRPSVDFLCKPDYGSPCYTPEDCDDTQGLTCAQGTCQCYNSTWNYQGQFGCVDPNNPQYNEMLRLLNQTEFLLKENKLELKDMFNDLGIQNDPDASDLTLSNFLASARQDTYNTNDLQFAAQNQDSQSSGVNLQQLLSLFQTFQSLIPRNNNNNNNGGGGRGFFRNLFRGNNQGGYPAASTTAAPSGYGPPGQPEGMGQRMGLLNSFLNLFNQMIPIVRQLRMRFNPVRFFQNLVMRFSPTTTPAPAPAPAAIHNAPPTIISSSGNYQSNPIFDDPGQPQQGQTGGQGQGSFRFFMRTRDRFRNFLRGKPGGYPAAMPPPDKGYGPPGETPPPAEDPPADAPPPADAASSAHANYFNNNNPRAAFQTNQQPQYSTIQFTNGNVNQQQQQQHHQQQQQQQQQPHHQQQQHHQQIQQIPQSAPAPPPPQRQQNFGNSPSPSSNSYLAGHHHNPQSFYSSQKPQQSTNHAAQQFNGNYNNNNQHQNNNFNGQATSHHQTTFVPHPQPSSNPPHQYPSSPPGNHQNNNIFDSSTNSFVNRPPTVTSGTASPPPPIPHFKLQVPQKAPASTHESLSQNFILSEADDPHPGFTPLSTPSTTPAEHQQNHQQLTSFRTSARFERIGHHDDQQQHQNTAAENWRESF